eukprot:15473235-Alexandrium_andersonii.AAC.1
MAGRSVVPMAACSVVVVVVVDVVVVVARSKTPYIALAMIAKSLVAMDMASRVRLRNPCCKAAN